MKRVLLVSAMLIGCSSFVMAEDTMKDWFVGGEIGGMNIKLKVSASDSSSGASASDEDSTSTMYETVKVGRYYENSRVYGALSIQNEKDDFSSHSLSLGWDYLFKNSTKFTPFVGIHGGYTWAKVDDATVSALDLDKPKGSHVGMGVGVLYPIMNNLELEAGARYTKMYVEDEITIGTVSVKVEGTSNSQYYLGLNYRF